MAYEGGRFHFITEYSSSYIDAKEVTQDRKNAAYRLAPTRLLISLSYRAQTHLPNKLSPSILITN